MSKEFIRSGKKSKGILENITVVARDKWSSKNPNLAAVKTHKMLSTKEAFGV